MNPRAIRVILVRPRDPLNIGACARAMANFGLSDLVVVAPYEPVWRETRSAPGAEDLVRTARAVGSWEEAVKGCSWIMGTSSFHQRPIEHAVVELSQLKRSLAEGNAGGVLWALVFGSERSGLSNAELARCDRIVHIPTQRQAPSMNLGQAVAVVLYELTREADQPSRSPGRVRAQDPAPLLESLATLGQAIDYPPGYTPAARWGRIRQAFQGAILPHDTVRFLLSYSRWLLKKFNAKRLSSTSSER